MANIDSRIVEMKFDNKDFEKNAQQSLDTLDKLRQATDKKLSGDSLKGLSDAANKLDLSHLNESVDQVSSRFSNLGIIGTTALVRLTNAAIDAGKKLAHALISPITEKGFSRALNIENAKFQLEGLGVAWADIKNDIDYGVKDTAYGLDSAAKAAAQLVASGVQVGDSMATVLRSISGVAAMTNSSYEEISPIFTTVAGQGKLMTMQLRQLENRGLNAAATIAKSMGTTEAAVREMVSKGKIDFETFAKAMDEAFGEHAKKGNKTFTGSLANMKSALGRIGASFYTPAMDAGITIFNRLREVFNALHKALGPMISDFEGISNAVKTMFHRFDKVENVGKSIANVVMGIWNVFNAGGKIIYAIGEALFNAFGGESGITGGMLAMSTAFERLTSKLVPSQKVLNGIGMVFRGLFEVLLIIPKALVGIIGKITGVSVGFKGIGDSIGDILTVIGTLLTAFAKFVVQSGILETILTGIVTVLGGLAFGFIALGKSVVNLVTAFFRLQPVQNILNGFLSIFRRIGDFVIPVINKIKTAVTEFKTRFNSLSNTDMGFFAKIRESLSGIGDILKPAGSAFDRFASIFRKKSKEIETDAEGLEFVITGTGEAMTRTMSFDESISSGQTALEKIRIIFTAIKDAIVNNLTLGKVVAIGFAIAMIKALRQVTTSVRSLRAFTSLLFNIGYALKQNARATIIKSVATSIALLAGSLFLLSRIDAGKLKQAAIALSMVLGVLAAATVAVGLISLKFRELGLQNDLLRLPAIMVGISVAAAILTGALWKLQEMPVMDALKNVVKLGALIGLLAGVMVIMGHFKVPLTMGSLSVVAFAIATNLMVRALLKLKGQDIDDAMVNCTKIVLLIGALSVVGSGLTISGGIGLVLATLALSIILKTLDKLQIQLNAVSDVGWMMMGRLAGLIMVISAIKSICTTINKLGQPKYTINQAKIGPVIIGIGVTLIGLTQLIKTLQSIDWSVDGAKIATGLITTIVGMIALVAVLNDKRISGAFAEKSGKTILAITAMLLSLAVSMKILKSIKFEGIGDFLGFAGVFALLIGGLVSIIGMSTKLKPGALQGLTLVVMGLVAIIAEMIVMSAIPWQSLIAPVLGISTVMVAFGVMMMLTSKLVNGRTPKVNKVLALLEVIGIIATIGMSLVALKDADPISLLTAVGSMLVLMIAVGKLVQYLDKIGNIGKKAVGKLQALFVVAGMMAGLALALAPLAKADWNDILAAALAASGALMACAGVLTIISSIKFDPKSLLSLVGLAGVAGTFVILSIAMKSLAEVDGGKLMSAAKAMAIIIGVLGGLSAVLMGIGAAVPIAMLALPAFALVIFSTASMMETASKAFDLIIRSLQRFNEFLPTFGPNLADFLTKIGSIGNLELIAGVTAAAVALGILLVPLGGLAVVGLLLGPASMGFVTMASGLVALIAPLQSIVALPILELAASLTALGVIFGSFGAFAGLLIAGAGAILLLSNALMVLSPAAQAVANVNLINLAIGLAALGASSALVGAMSPLIIAASVAFTMLSGSLMILSGSIVTMLNGLQLVSQFTRGLSEESRKMVEIGRNFVQGFIDGLKSMVSNVTSAAKEMAAGALNTIKNFLGIHSPSAVLKQIGQFFGLGFANGIDETKSLGENAAAMLGSSTIGSLTSSLNNGQLDGVISMIRSKIQSLGMDVAWLDNMMGRVNNANVRFAKVQKGHENNWRALADSAKKTGVEVDKYGARVDKTKHITAETAKETDLFSDALSNLGGGGGGTAGKAGEQIEEFSKSIYDKISGAIDIFGEFSKKTEMTKEKLLANMKSQIDGVAEWSTKLSSLAERGVSEGLLKHLADMGPQGYEYVHAFTTMTTEELARANEMYATQMAMPATATMQIADSFRKTGMDVGEGFLKGLAGKLPQLHEAGVKDGEAVLNGTKDALDSHSPSREMMKVGSDAMLGMIQGITDTMPQLLTHINLQSTVILFRFKTKLSMTKFQEVGRNICLGIAAGIQTNTSIITDAAKAAAQAAYNAAKNALNIHSPSRLMMEVGRYYDEGFAIGIEKNASSIDKAVSNVAKSSIDIMRQSISDIYTGLFDEIDMNPVIKPTLDLSNVQAGAARMNSMLNSRQVAISNLGQALGNAQVGTNGNSFQFIQNNYSPKALSRLDIYRNTKNQFSMMKGMVNMA